MTQLNIMQRVFEAIAARGPVGLEGLHDLPYDRESVRYAVRRLRKMRPHVLRCNKVKGRWVCTIARGATLPDDGRGGLR